MSIQQMLKKSPAEINNYAIDKESNILLSDISTNNPTEYLMIRDIILRMNNYTEVWQDQYARQNNSHIPRTIPYNLEHICTDRRIIPEAPHAVYNLEALKKYSFFRKGGYSLVFTADVPLSEGPEYRTEPANAKLTHPTIISVNIPSCVKIYNTPLANNDSELEKLYNMASEEIDTLVKLSSINQNYLLLGIGTIAYEDHVMPYIVTPKLGLRTLYQHVVRKGPLDESEIIKIMRSITKELAQLHDKKHAIHRDLHADNILLTIDDNNQITSANLIDFGKCRMVSEQQNEFELTSITGCRHNIPPEIIDITRSSGVRPYYPTYDKDVFSLAAIEYFMATAKYPFSPRSTAESHQLALIGQNRFEVLRTASKLNDMPLDINIRDIITYQHRNNIVTPANSERRKCGATPISDEMELSIHQSLCREGIRPNNLHEITGPFALPKKRNYSTIQHIIRESRFFKRFIT